MFKPEIRKEYRTIKDSGLFDPVFYLYNSPDVRKADMDPLMHFIHHGWREGRNPSEKFNTKYYLETYPDVERTGINPLLHFLYSGMSEGRTPLPDPDAQIPVDPATAIAQITEKLSELPPEDDVIEVVEDLLNYPGYTPYEIPPRGNTDRKHKVSICIPVFNGARYLQDCVNSILAQSFYDFELICINDASSDDSKAIIQSFNDPRIKYFENECNLGLIGNWNKCLESASGDYVCIFHQDDLMSPYNLEKKVALLDREKHVGLIYSDTVIIDQTWRIESPHWFELLDPNVDFIKPGRAFFDLMLRSMNLICCPSVVARRECYEKLAGFDVRLPFTGDMEMWMRIALFYDVAYLSEPLLQYRMHESNQSRHYQSLDLVHLYQCKRMILEKYSQQMDIPYYDALLEDTAQRIKDRIIYEHDRKQYMTAKQYLFFLEKIQNLHHAPDLNESH